jgi:WD40 repeat protein
MRTPFLLTVPLLAASPLTWAGAPDRAEPARADLHGDPLPPRAIARLGTARWRTGAQITDLVYSPDGKTLAAGSRGRLYLFDAATGEVKKCFRPKLDHIYFFAFSPDSKRLAWTQYFASPTVTDRGTVQVWELSAGRKALDVKGNSECWLGWSAEGEPLGLSRGGNTFLLRNLASGRTTWLKPADFKHNSLYSLFVHSAAGRMLASADDDGVLHVWDTTTGARRCTLNGGVSSVRDLACSHDGRILASLALNKVQLWDAAAGKLLRVVAANEKDVNAIALTRDGKTLATVGEREARFWDVATGKELRRTREKRPFGRAVTFSPDGKTLATDAGFGGAVHL